MMDYNKEIMFYRYNKADTHMSSQRLWPEDINLVQTQARQKSQHEGAEVNRYISLLIVAILAFDSC